MTTNTKNLQDIKDGIILFFRAIFFLHFLHLTNSIKCKRYCILILLNAFCTFLLTAQEHPPIRNFQAMEYKGENQNWSISQSDDKIIYIANNSGLLRYNGARWDHYESPNETIIRSLVVADERIYTGSYMEFGYWTETDQGRLSYTSLSTIMKIAHIEDEEFWNIICMPDGVLFQSHDRIYIYDPKSETSKIIESKGRITKIFEVGGSIFFQSLWEGIFKIEGGEKVLFSNERNLTENEVVGIFDSGNGLLILTQEEGFLLLIGENISRWEVPVNDQLKQTQLYSAIRLKNNNFALGTISEGLICIDADGKLVYKIGEPQGLQNSTILSLFEDKDQNIWLALDNGISFVNMNSSLKMFRNRKAGIGSVYAAQKFNNNLYLGTNQGLFFRPIESKEDFIIVKGTEGQVWSLRSIGNSLFCGHHNGTYIIEGENARQIFGEQGTWEIKSIEGNPDLLLLGCYDGMFVIEKHSGRWRFRNKIEGFDNSSRYIEELDHKIFVNHEYKGVFQIKVDEKFSKAISVEIDSSIRSANSGLAKFKGEIFYAYIGGILKFDDGLNKFVRDSLYSKAYDSDDYISGRMIVDEDQEGLWVFTKSGITNISQSDLTKGQTFKTYPLNHRDRNNVVEYENIVKYGEESHLVGVESGYILINTKNFEIDDFSVSIDKIVVTDNQRQHPSKQVNPDVREFPNSDNSIGFSFHSPEYHKFLTLMYQYKLEGYREDWSEWSTSSTVVFENLPPGNFAFNVRARLGNKVSNELAVHEFLIRKPWFRTWPMIILFCLLLLMLLGLMHYLYNWYFKKQKEKLIVSNERKLELERVKSEQEIIRLKNDQLKNDIESKSKELATSTLKVVRKNELLSKIKSHLLELHDKDAIAPVIKLIDQNLNHVDNWNLFKKAFENVDRNFLEKLNERHPNLTPNDIKLCTYLRLNLSSKEIAPLFNISARSVEIKRYRLRKKLNLQHEENLVNYILEI